MRNNLSLKIAIITSLSVSLSACALLQGPKDQLAFESYRDGNAEVYIVDEDGSNLQNLTNNSAYDGTPSWSPDGTKIAFTSERGENPEIFIMDQDGANVLAVTSGEGYNVMPAWAPDGLQLLFASNRTYTVEEGGGVLEVPGNTKLWSLLLGVGIVERKTSELGTDLFPSWSPDAESFVFMSTRDGNAEIYLWNEEGEEIRLTDHPELDMNPDFSPDGSKIAFMSSRDGNKEIYVIELEGGAEPINLSNHPANDSDPAWSPDGSRLAFTSDRDGNVEIYIMQADGTGVVRVTDHPADDILPEWKPNP